MVLPMMARSSASHARAVSWPGASCPSPSPSVSPVPLGAVVRPARRVVAEPVELDAEPDQVLQGGGVDLAGHERGHRGVAGHGPGGVAVQPRAAVAAAAEASARCPAHWARTRAVHSSSSGLELQLRV